jgi:hypothetical protein
MTGQPLGFVVDLFRIDAFCGTDEVTEDDGYELLIHDVRKIWDEERKNKVYALFFLLL